MNSHIIRIAILVVTAATAGCTSQSANDERVAQLEQQLAESQKQLAEQKAADAGQAPGSTVAPEAAAPTPSPARPATQAPARPAGGAQNRPAPAPAPAPAPPQEEQAAAQRALDEQKAVNAQQAETNAQVQQQVEQLKPREVTLPAGTLVPVRTTGELTTAKLSDGATFNAILERDLKSDDTVLAKAGSRVTGFVISSDPGGRVKGTASLTVGIRSVVGTSGSAISVRTDSYSVDAASTKKRDAVRTGIASGIGAAIGGIAGGGSGAAIGAGVGAAAGVGANMATRGEPAVIPAEELIEFKLASPVTVTIQP